MRKTGVQSELRFVRYTKTPRNKKKGKEGINLLQGENGELVMVNYEMVTPISYLFVRLGLVSKQ